MIHYKDKTFCHFDQCLNFKTCDRAYTDQVRADAVRWWGSEDAPIALWSSEPRCYDAPQNA